jgi:hypothetical protein
LGNDGIEEGTIFVLFGLNGGRTIFVLGSKDPEADERLNPTIWFG